jgi:hypothetical protein
LHPARALSFLSRRKQEALQPQSFAHPPTGTSTSTSSANVFCDLLASLEEDEAPPAPPPPPLQKTGGDQTFKEASFLPPRVQFKANSREENDSFFCLENPLLPDIDEDGQKTLASEKKAVSNVQTKKGGAKSKKNGSSLKIIKASRKFTQELNFDLIDDEELCNL